MDNNTKPVDTKDRLGDKVERVMKRIGADKVAKAYEQVTKKPCGCQKRKQMLNDLDRKIRG